MLYSVGNHAMPSGMSVDIDFIDGSCIYMRIVQQQSPRSGYYIAAQGSAQETSTPILMLWYPSHELRGLSPRTR